MSTAKASTDNKPEFGTPQKVWDVTERMQKLEDQRALDRAKINTLFNGNRPYTDDEVKKFNIQINVNWGQGPRIMADANRQLNNAFIHPGTLFNCTLEEGKPDKRDEWSQIVTKEIHKPLQRGRSGKRHHFIIRSRNANIAMHGIGAVWWPNGFRWMPRFLPLEDLLIPTDTACDFSNLRYFAINLYLTPGELFDMTHGERTIAGWNKEMVRKLLAEQAGRYDENLPSTWRNQPEEMAEIVKQNRGWFYSDAIPKIKLRAFFFQEIDEPNKWYRHIIVRESANSGEVKTDKFLFDGSNQPFATHIEEILNVQFGDSSLVAPLKYHSVRGLGVPLFAPVETLNRLQCEFVQHVFEQLKMYFKINDPADRDRVKNVVLQAYGFIPEGLSIVPREQRHQIDSSLVESALGQMRQIMQENSASFVQDIAKDTGREMTAFEAKARLNQVNVMVSSMLGMLYLQEAFYQQELFRRFCNKQSLDPQVKEFREECVKRGVPEDMLVPKKWRIVPERVLGGGDQTLAQMQSQWLLDHITMYDPGAQQKIKRLATATMLGDNDKGTLFVPTSPVLATDGTFAAENVFGTLMQGIQVALREGIDHQGYIDALLKMAGSVVARISQTDNMGTIEEVIGLQTVLQNAGQHMMILAQDDRNKQLVKQYGDVAGQLLNEIKGFAQRISEQQQQQMQQQGDVDGMAKAQSIMMLAKVKAATMEQSAALKARHKDMSFKMDQARKNLETLADIKRENLRQHQDIWNQSMSDATKTLNETKAAQVRLRMDKQRMEMQQQNSVAKE